VWALSLKVAVTAVCVFSLLAVTRIRRLEPVFSGFLVGLLTGTIGLCVHIPAKESVDSSILLRVEEPPRHPQTDQIVFVGRDLLAASQGLLRCTAVDLPWRHATRLRQGSVVWVRGAVMPVERPLNPFAWEGWLWRGGIGGAIKVRYVSEALEHHVSFMERTRDLVARAVRGVLDERRGGELLLSMAFGYRDVLSSPVEKSFTALGLKHLLVVSGYQVSLVFGVWYAIALGLMRLMRIAYSVRAIVTLFALLVSAVFVLFIGVELSALRALVAAACVCATQVFERAGGFAQRWGVALLIVELLSPWAVFDMGVQLTFAALAGIGIGSRLARGGLGMSFVWVTTCVWLLTSLVVLVWNGSLSLVALPLNLIIAAPWSFLNCVVGGCGVILLIGSKRLGEPVVQLVAWVNEVLANVLLELAESPLKAVVLQGWSRWMVCAAFVVCVAAISVRATHHSPLISSGHR